MSDLVNGSASGSQAARCAVRTNLLVQHLRGAALFAAECRAIEDRATPPIANTGATEDDGLRTRALATAAVMLSAAALEAAANELRLDVADRSKTAPERLSRIRDSFLRRWDDKRHTIGKYQSALTIADATAFREDEACHAAVVGLIDLRHVLVHYKPESNDSPKMNRRIETQIGLLFPPNPRTHASQSFIPYRCLGAGCAQWTVRSARDFIVAFYDRLGVRAPILDHAPELWA